MHVLWLYFWWIQYIYLHLCDNREDWWQRWKRSRTFRSTLELSVKYIRRCWSFKFFIPAVNNLFVYLDIQMFSLLCVYMHIYTHTYTHAISLQGCWNQMFRSELFIPRVVHLNDYKQPAFGADCMVTISAKTKQLAPLRAETLLFQWLSYPNMFIPHQNTTLCGYRCTAKTKIPKIWYNYQDFSNIIDFFIIFNLQKL